ncbi:MAG TPA: hypothetical protein DEP42_06855 [Ruminococcaceae bacterium]|nr:hypothetical protein [Oscillospiraceae bacterium]
MRDYSVDTKAHSISLVESRYGDIYVFTNDDPIGKSLLTYGEWAEAEITFLSTFIGLGSSVVDIGANIGNHTLAFAKRVGPLGLVTAVEPQKQLFDAMNETLSRNKMFNVKSINAAAGKNIKNAYVPEVDYSEHVNSGAIKLQDENSSTGNLKAVPTVRVDDLNLDSCHLVKIDVEGMEADVLSGMAKTISKFQPIVFTECNSVQSASEILSIINWAGYQKFFIRTQAYNPKNFLKNHDNLFGVAEETALLFLPESLCCLMPENNAGCVAIKVETLDEIAESIIVTPRYGDTTPFDRKPDFWRENFDELKIKCDLMQENKNKEKDNFVKENARLEYRAESLALELKNIKHSLSERKNIFEQQNIFMQQLSDQVSQKDGVINIKQSEIDAIYRSTSWRITSPIRRIKRFLCK